jgi:NDP-mannose synthase
VEIAEGKLTGYIEKPVYHYDVSMGVNILNVLSARKFLIPGQHLDLPDLMTLLREDGQSVHCYQEPCYWLDIGRVDDYQTANDIFESRKSEFLP